MLKSDEIVLFRTDGIPDDDKQKLAELVSTPLRVYNYGEMSYIFSIYNRYISPSENLDMNCRACRSDVINKLKRIVSIWKEHNKI